MNIAIIGCGNMGGAIARGIASNPVFFQDNKLAVANRTAPKLDALKAEFPQIEISTDNSKVVRAADIVILAVKPWLVDKVLDEVFEVVDKSQLIVSVASGVTIEHLRSLLQGEDGCPTIIRAIPNTAISIGESMTVVAHAGAAEADVETVVKIFSAMGKAMAIEERLMGAATALCSCGTAYALRYVRAAVEGAVEMGIPPKQAQEMVCQTVKGAVELLQQTGSHPEVEIDKVTTPGGVTIKGLNTMEECGFTNAVIKGLKASNN